MNIEEAQERLLKERGDSEGYHGVFDEIIEEKLREYDPEFVDALKETYANSGESRWYA